MPSPKPQQLVWLKVVQGWSMLLVVIGHVTLTHVFLDPSTPAATLIERIVYGFHMPLFMFTSGWLFSRTRLRRADWTAKRTLADKLKRLGLPLLFFTLICLLPKILLAPLMAHPAELSVDYLVEVVLLRTNPMAEMWFIETLLLFMAGFTVYRMALRHPIGEWLLLGAALLAYFFLPRDVTTFVLNRISAYFLFFVGGILVEAHRLEAYLDRTAGIVVSTLLFVLLNLGVALGVRVPALLLEVTGIAFSYALCFRLASLWPDVFSSFRDYTYQIFLMGIFPQMGLRFLYAALHVEALFWPCYVTSVLVGLYVPVLVSRVALRLPWRWLHLCLGLSR